jgi:hypothetical protein
MESPAKNVARVVILGALAVNPVSSIADSPRVPSDAAPSNLTPIPQFSCSEKRLSLSRDQLEQTALAEFERKGGRPLAAGEFEAELKPRGCDWWVSVFVKPFAPGNHFAVLISGVDGKVKDFVRGH